MNLGITIVSGRMALRGELDLETAAILHAELADQGEQVFVVDVADVTFIDCAGIRALIELRATHPGVRIEHPSSMLVRMLTILDLTDQVLAVDPVGAPALVA
jgi:anti-anti-sigma factor